MALAQIDNGLTSLEAAYAERLHRWQEMAIQRIAEVARKTAPEILATAGLGIRGSLGELSNDLINLRNRIANFGRGQVNEELKRQGII